MIRAIKKRKTKKDAPEVQRNTFTLSLQKKHLHRSSVASYLNTTVFWGTIKMFQTSPTLFPGSGIKATQMPSAAQSFVSFVSHLCICVCKRTRCVSDGLSHLWVLSLFKSPRQITTSGRPRSVSFISSQWSQLPFPQWLLGHLSQGTWNMRRNLSISEQHFIRFSFPSAAPSLDN